MWESRSREHHPKKNSSSRKEEEEKKREREKGRFAERTHGLVPPLSVRDITKDIAMRNHHNLLCLGAQPRVLIVVMVVVTAQPLTNPARAFFNAERVKDPLFRVPGWRAGPMRRRVRGGGG